MSELVEVQAAALDQPLEGSRHYRQSIPIAGWLFAGAQHSRLRRVLAKQGDELLCSTELFYPRSDVAAALKLDSAVTTGFRMIGSVSNRSLLGKTLALSIFAEFENGETRQVFETQISLFEDDYTKAPYGDLCNPEATGQLRRENIYSTGNPAAQGSQECIQLITDFLAPGSSVFDVGCGIGAYARPLMSAGFRWQGCEINDVFIDQMRRDGLDVRKIASGVKLPAGDKEFDAAIAIEVLEHLPNPQPFVAEIARVVRKRAIFSVPNMETLPFLAGRLVAPWHILEGDHHNFFSRFNLTPLLKQHFRAVEVIGYGAQPLRSAEDVVLPYHLLAICSH